MVKLKDILSEKLTYSDYKSYKNDLIKAATELANHHERISKGFEKNNQSKDAVRGEMIKAEKFRQMVNYTKKLIP